MAVYGTNNPDQAENLWVKCESDAHVWFGNLEADQGIDAEIAGVRQQEPEEHPADLVALETNRAAADRGGDKTTSVGLDWPHAKEARWTRGQEGP